jgi:hypothetical protein
MQERLRPTTRVSASREIDGVVSFAEALQKANTPIARKNSVPAKPYTAVRILAPLRISFCNPECR